MRSPVDHPDRKFFVRGYRAMGYSESVFVYRGVAYVDTFFENDGRGDLQDRRIKDPALEDTLAVLLRKGGRLVEVCEYALLDRKDWNSGNSQHQGRDT